MSTVALDREQGDVAVTETPRFSRRRLVIALGMVGACAIAWFGYNWWTVGRFIQETDDAYVGGNVTAISPHVEGFVSEILVGDNQHVDANQLLIRLDPRDLDAAIERAAGPRGHPGSHNRF